MLASVNAFVVSIHTTYCIVKGFNTVGQNFSTSTKKAEIITHMDCGYRPQISGALFSYLGQETIEVGRHAGTAISLAVGLQLLAALSLKF